MIRLVSRLTLILTGIAFSAPGIASARGADEQGTVIEEIVVTAQKRAESLNEVPISISAFDQAQMDQANIHVYS